MNPYECENCNEASTQYACEKCEQEEKDTFRKKVGLAIVVGGIILAVLLLGL